MESQKPFSLSAFSSNLKDFYSFKDLGRIWELSNLETVVVRLAEKKKKKKPHGTPLPLLCFCTELTVVAVHHLQKMGENKGWCWFRQYQQFTWHFSCWMYQQEQPQSHQEHFSIPQVFLTVQLKHPHTIILVRISEFPAINLPLDVCILWWRSWKGKNIAAAKKKWQLNREMHEWKHVTRGGDPVSKYQAITAKLYEGMLWLCFGTGGLLSTEHLPWSKKITASLGLPCT